MKQTAIAILRGYSSFLKNASSFTGVLLFFLLLACLVGYPMWYLATEHSWAYTLGALGILIFLGIVSFALRLRRIHSQKGIKGIREAIGGFCIKTGKTLFVVFGCVGIAFLFGHGMLVFGIAGVAAFLIVSGFLFFRKLK